MSSETVGRDPGSCTVHSPTPSGSANHPEGILGAAGTPGGHVRPCLFVCTTLLSGMRPLWSAPLLPPPWVPPLLPMQPWAPSGLPLTNCVASGRLNFVSLSLNFPFCKK